MVVGLNLYCFLLLGCSVFRGYNFVSITVCCAPSYKDPILNLNNPKDVLFILSNISTIKSIFFEFLSQASPTTL